MKNKFFSPKHDEKKKIENIWSFSIVWIYIVNNKMLTIKVSYIF